MGFRSHQACCDPINYPSQRQPTARAAPDGACSFCDLGFYKYSAPTALRESQRYSIPQPATVRLRLAIRLRLTPTSVLLRRGKSAGQVNYPGSPAPKIINPQSHAPRLRFTDGFKDGIYRNNATRPLKEGFFSRCESVPGQKCPA
jgi:hypothetical protein